MTRESLRLEQADKIMSAIETALQAGYEVTFKPALVGGTVVKIGAAGGSGAIAIARKEARDAAAHALQIVLNDLSEAAHQKSQVFRRAMNDQAEILEGTGT